MSLSILELKKAGTCEEKLAHGLALYNSATMQRVFDKGLLAMLGLLLALIVANGVVEYHNVR